MVPLPDGVTVTPNASVVLGPGAIHVMCLGVEAGFGEGDTATAELDFREAGSFEITADVRRSS